MEKKIYNLRRRIVGRVNFEEFTEAGFVIPKSYIKPTPFYKKQGEELVKSFELANELFKKYDLNSYEYFLHEAQKPATIDEHFFLVDNTNNKIWSVRVASTETTGLTVAVGLNEEPIVEYPIEDLLNYAGGSLSFQEGTSSYRISGGAFQEFIEKLWGIYSKK